MRTPYATRYLANEYKCIAKVVSDDSYLHMNEFEFVAACMKQSGGSVDPARAKKIYYDLMKDAGLTTEFSPMKSDPEDNGDHSWEYYSEGRVFTEDEYAKKHAHGSYFKS